MPSPWDEPFYLAALIVTAMPTSTNIMVMAELVGGEAREPMGTCLFAQYCVAPVLLTASVTLIIAVVCGY